MKRIFALFVFGLLLLSCVQQTKKDQIIEKVWETDSILKTPESVIYDKVNDVLYVSNMNKGSWEKDGDGFITKLSTDGSVLELEWVTGMSAPKGMGIYNGNLFVADCDEMIIIDIEKAYVKQRILADSAKTLNDVDIDANGNVYVSDMENALVYILRDSVLKPWQAIDGQSSINGLFSEGGSLLVGGDRITKVDLETGKQDIYITETGGIDGIEKVTDGKYVISDWSGTVQLVSPVDSAIVLLDTKPQNINAADIEYIMEKNLLLVPTFFDNRVMGYSLKP